MESWPHLAVNPNNPNNIAVSWVEDWGDGIVVGVSHDGGLSWTKSIPRQNSHCSGERRYNSAYDQHLSFGPDEHLYLSTFNRDSQTGFRRVTVHVSTDGGVTWSLPATLAESVVDPLNLLDWSWVTADSTQPGTVYAGWFVLQDEVTHAETRMRLSRSTDGGQSWETPWDISPAPNGFFRLGPMIVSLPDGSLVNLIYQLPECPLLGCPPQTAQVMATRSEDQGNTWSTPVVIAERDNYRLSFDDDERVNKLGLPALGLPAVSRDGTIYYAWADIAADYSSKLFLTSSSDGGVTWRTPQVIRASNGPMGNANVAVSPDNRVGVLFYDFRNDVAGDETAMADVWFVSAPARAQGLGAWKERHVAGPFDILRVPDHIGLYQGIEGVEGGFLSAYTLGGTPPAVVGPTDIFFRRLPIHP